MGTTQMPVPHITGLLAGQSGKGKEESMQLCKIIMPEVIVYNASSFGLVSGNQSCGDAREKAHGAKHLPEARSPRHPYIWHRLNTCVGLPVAKRYIGPTSPGFVSFIAETSMRCS